MPQEESGRFLFDIVPSHGLEQGLNFRRKLIRATVTSRQSPFPQFSVSKSENPECLEESEEQGTLLSVGKQMSSELQSKVYTLEENRALLRALSSQRFSLRTPMGRSLTREELGNSHSGVLPRKNHRS